MAAEPPEEARGLALREAKLALRTRVLLARDALGEDERTRRSAAITQGLLRLPSFAAAGSVLLTCTFRSEWQSAGVIRAALAQGKRVALPRVNAATRMLELHRITDADCDVVPGYQGIPEPRASLPSCGASEIGWVLVPGVAFDRRGRRLGYGGGFYDRLLPLLSPDAPRVAGAYSLQIVERVPSAPHDVTMDVIVTEDGAIEPGTHA